MTSRRHSFLELRDLCKRFGEVRVLEGLSLEVEEGEVLALLGLSGSGKTTALRLLAGFETPDAGTIHLDGDDLVRVPPAKRGVGMVFQHYALFPHMTVAENVAFGLQSQGWRKAKIEERVAEMLRLVDLESYGSRRPAEISGGQQQRIALARALAPEPRLLLLDEPLSNLDPALRERTRSELLLAVRRIGITTVLVTHEQEEAFHLGDRVAVLNQGRLEQVGSPTDLYRRPATRFVASFVGRSSSLRGVVDEIDNDRIGVRLGGEAEGVARWWGRATEGLEPGTEVDLVVRPESVVEVPPSDPAAMAGTITGVRFTGPLTYALIDLEGDLGRIEMRIEGEEDPTGRRVHVAPAGSGPALSLFPIR
ncbi:MAG: ABC transporter ATP-binding protein [Thermoanaerobaculia bacterium]|nr:ABC transporter ATP-binding protein [Thermoanaerobaculia bacterium]